MWNFKLCSILTLIAIFGIAEDINKISRFVFFIGQDMFGRYRCEFGQALTTNLGASQGIGLATAVQMAELGSHNIVLACRNKQKAEEAVDLVQSKNAEVEVSYVLVDFACLDSVRELTEKICSMNLTFQVVVLNAGVLKPKKRTTNDGFEATFQVNYLGQYMLIKAIMEHQLPKNKPVKVITLTSAMYRLCGTLFPVKRNPKKWRKMFNRPDQQWKAYAMSKLAMALLATWLKSNGVSAVTIDPGCVRTGMADSAGLGRRIRQILGGVLGNLMISPEVAAKNVVYCIENTEFFAAAEYRQTHQNGKLNSVVMKKRNQDMLRQLSEELVQEYKKSLSIE